MVKRNTKKGGSPQVATRDFSNYKYIYCFGDMEGQFPFTSKITRVKFMYDRKFTKISVNQEQYKENKVDYEERSKYFPKTSTNSNFITLNSKKFIDIKTSENDGTASAFVCVGDLCDHGKYDIRWLMAIVNNAHPHSILCCLGNRDFNKLRRIDESFIVKVGSQWSSIWDETSNSKSLTDFVQEIADGWKLDKSI